MCLLKWFLHSYVKLPEGPFPGPGFPRGPRPSRRAMDQSCLASLPRTWHGGKALTCCNAGLSIHGELSKWLVYNRRSQENAHVDILWYLKPGKGWLDQHTTRLDWMKHVESASDGWLMAGWWLVDGWLQVGSWLLLPGFRMEWSADPFWESLIIFSKMVMIKSLAFTELFGRGGKTLETHPYT